MRYDLKPDDRKRLREIINVANYDGRSISPIPEISSPEINQSASSTILLGNRIYFDNTFDNRSFFLPLCDLLLIDPPVNRALGRINVALDWTHRYAALSGFPSFPPSCFPQHGARIDFQHGAQWPRIGAHTYYRICFVSRIIPDSVDEEALSVPRSFAAILAAFSFCFLLTASPPA